MQLSVSAEFLVSSRCSLRLDGDSCTLPVANLRYQAALDRRTAVTKGTAANEQKGTRTVTVSPLACTARRPDPATVTGPAGSSMPQSTVLAMPVGVLSYFFALRV